MTELHDGLLADRPRREGHWVLNHARIAAIRTPNKGTAIAADIFRDSEIRSSSLFKLVRVTLGPPNCAMCSSGILSYPGRLFSPTYGCKSFAHINMKAGSMNLSRMSLGPTFWTEKIRWPLYVGSTCKPEILIRPWNLYLDLIDRSPIRSGGIEISSNVLTSANCPGGKSTYGES